GGEPENCCDSQEKVHLPRSAPVLGFFSTLVLVRIVTLVVTLTPHSACTESSVPARCARPTLSTDQELPFERTMPLRWITLSRCLISVGSPPSTFARSETVPPPMPKESTARSNSI